MPNPSIKFPGWLTNWIAEKDISLWGSADLRGISSTLENEETAFPFAIAWAVPMNPHMMAGIRNGPDQTYTDEYVKVNHHINELSSAMAAEIEKRGYRSTPLAASVRSDPVNIKGDFPHKTAATRAGLGWIGKHCQLITRRFGPWVRLGTVFTDMPLTCGQPIEKSYCGKCRICVEACPAKALTGNTWYPGLPREKILDVRACDQWKKVHYYQFQKGHVCGICSAVCPHGLKFLKRMSSKA